MKQIKILPRTNIDYTIIPNQFIDNYMADSNGDFIKVYLLLIRYISSQDFVFYTEQFADKLNLTESDIFRALNYWASKELLYIKSQNGIIEFIELLPFESSNKVQTIRTMETNVSEVDETAASSDSVVDNSVVHLNISNKPHYTMEELAEFMSASKYKQLIFITSRYLGKNLTQNDLTALISFHDWLGLPLDVIELLIEYCASNNHRNMRYIETIAIDWADNNINTVEKAKIKIELFSKNYYKIKKALGLSNRTPVEFEVKLMDKWINDYSFDMEIILEACNKTVKQTSNGSIQYADKILSYWYKNKVHTISDIEALDKNYKLSSKPKTNTPATGKSNKFVNYNQRTYDFDELEKKAIELQLKETSERNYS
jgi:DnaD/phage-associated family protein